MTVTLLQSSPLYLAAHACRMSHDNHHLSDSQPQYDVVDGMYEGTICGTKDRALIERVGNKFKHKSILEQLVYWFDIDGISRACLQELARHRTARLTAKSSRYTLKRLKDEAPFTSYTDLQSQEYCDNGYQRAVKYLVMTTDDRVNRMSILALDNLRDLVAEGISNDLSKYALPEAFRTRLQWQIDGRNLQNFLQLRSAPDALWEIRHLARSIYDQLPSDHRHLYSSYFNA